MVRRGHTGRVSTVWWSPDDSLLVTCGADGAVYEWRGTEGRRSRDFVQKGLQYACAVRRPGQCACAPAPALCTCTGPARPRLQVGTHPTGPGPTVAMPVGAPGSIFSLATDGRLRALGSGASGGLQVTQDLDVGPACTRVAMSLTGALGPCRPAGFRARAGGRTRRGARRDL